MTIAAILALAAAVVAQVLVFFRVLSPGNLAPVTFFALGIILILLGIVNGSDRKI